MKLRAQWEAWAAAGSTLRAELDRELAAARLEDLRAPLEPIEIAETVPRERSIEVPTYLVAGGKLQRICARHDAQGPNPTHAERVSDPRNASLTDAERLCTPRIASSTHAEGG